jgi:hypothetical protein
MFATIQYDTMIHDFKVNNDKWMGENMHGVISLLTVGVVSTL